MIHCSFLVGSQLSIMLCFKRLPPRLRLLLPPFAFFVAKKAENARSAVKLDGLCHENGRKRDKDRYTFFTPGAGRADGA